MSTATAAVSPVPVAVTAGTAALATEALVLGTGVEALGTIRALGRCGVRSFVHGSPRSPFLERSRFFRRLPAPEALGPQDVGRLLESLPFDSLVLVPCADPWVCAVASLPHALRARFPSAVPPSAAASALIDKGQLAAVLDTYEVPHPRTHVLAHPEELHELPDEALSGAFLKPRVSHEFQRRYRTKGVRCSGRSDAFERATEAAAAGLGVMLQEYVPGPPTAHHFVDGFVDRYGRVRALFARRRLRMHPEDFGNSSALVSIPLAEVQPVLEPLRRLLRGLAYRGVFSAEWKRDVRDGVFRLLEVNVRPWWYVEFAQKAGVNVPLMAYRDALGLDPGDAFEYRVGLRLVYPEHDRRACAALLRRGELSLVGWARSWLGACQPVLSADDPWPAVAGTAARLVSAAARRLSRRSSGVRA